MAQKIIDLTLELLKSSSSSPTSVFIASQGKRGVEDSHVKIEVIMNEVHPHNEGDIGNIFYLSTNLNDYLNFCRHQ